MHTAFKLHAAVGSRTVNGKAHFLHAAQLGDIGAQQLGFPSARLCVHVVHAVQTVGEQRRLFTARAAAYFHNDVFFVIFILRQQQKPNLFLQLFQTLFGLAIFLLGHFFQFRLKAAFFQQLFGPLKSVLGLRIGIACLRKRRQVFIFFH